MQQKVSRSPWKTDFCSSIPWGRLCCRFFLVCWNLLLFSPKLTVNVMTCLKMCLPFSCFIHAPNYVSLKFDHILSKSVSLFSTLGPDFCCCYVCLFHFFIVECGKLFSPWLENYATEGDFGVMGYV